MITAGLSVVMAAVSIQAAVRVYGQDCAEKKPEAESELHDQQNGFHGTRTYNAARGEESTVLTISLCNGYYFCEEKWTNNSREEENEVVVADVLSFSVDRNPSCLYGIGFCPYRVYHIRRLHIVKRMVA
jgi:hypothetical protein